MVDPDDIPLEQLTEIVRAICEVRAQQYGHVAVVIERGEIKFITRTVQVIAPGAHVQQSNKRERCAV